MVFQPHLLHCAVQYIYRKKALEQLPDGRKSFAKPFIIFLQIFLLHSFIKTLPYCQSHKTQF